MVSCRPAPVLEPRADRRLHRSRIRPVFVFTANMKARQCSNYRGPVCDFSLRMMHRSPRLYGLSFSDMGQATSVAPNLKSLTWEEAGATSDRGVKEDDSSWTFTWLWHYPDMHYSIDMQ